MEHPPVEDDEPVRLHVNSVEQFLIVIAIVDIGILFRGKFWAEEDPIDEFSIAILGSDGVSGTPILLSERLEFDRHPNRYAREPGGTMPVEIVSEQNFVVGRPSVLDGHVAGRIDFQNLGAPHREAPSKGLTGRK
jgi:hypothetical protein